MILGDSLLAVLVVTLLSGGGLSALAAWRRARGGSQLDVLSAAKVIYDEQREQVEELRKANRELAVQRDQLAEHNAELAVELARCNERIDDLTVRLEAREETIDGLQQRLDAVTDGH